MVRLALLLVFTVLWGMPASALAQGATFGPCGASVDAWVTRCNTLRRASVEAVECPAPGLFVLATPALRVEIARDPSRSFRRVNGWGVSPVGISGDWEGVAADKRAAFELVVACVTSDGSLPTLDVGTIQQAQAAQHTPPPAAEPRAPPPQAPPSSPSATTGPDSERAPLRLPWRPLLACAALLAAWWPLRARPKERRLAAAVAGACAAIVAARWVAVAPAFFHQNGQGPLWIEMPLTPRHPYGPGYAELFGWVVRLFPGRPDTAVFLAQEALAALAVCAAWGLARRCATSPEGREPVALALAACMLVNPALARMAGSESYFASCFSLEMIAAWALTHATLPPRRGGAAARLRALAPAVAGGMLLSLSVSVHPIAWLPSALVPLVMLVGPGSLRRRARRTALAYAVVGAVVAATALPGVLRVIYGEIGRRWMPHGNSHEILWSRVLEAEFPWLAGVVLLLATARRPVRVLPRVAAGLLLIAVVPMTDQAIMSATRPWITSAFAWLHAPVVVAALAATLSDVPRARWQAWALAAVVALGGAHFAARQYRAVTMLTTDALELRALIAWRDRLPAGATVALLWRAGDHLLAFPLYPNDPRGRQVLTLDVRGAPPTVFGRANVYWYHSSLCSTAQGRPYCDAVERGLGLTPVATTSLPSLWSLRRVDYDRERVPVALYRVRGAAAP